MDNENTLGPSALPAQVSIKEVAKLAGVSIATVSRSINTPEKVTEKTRAKVESAIRKTGYSPNTIARDRARTCNAQRLGARGGATAAKRRTLCVIL